MRATEFNFKILILGKPENKSETSSKANHGRVTSPVTPPSPFSLSPSINVDFDIDMLSPSWEDSSSRSATPVCNVQYTLLKDFCHTIVLRAQFAASGHFVWDITITYIFVNFGQTVSLDKS